MQHRVTVDLLPASAQTGKSLHYRKDPMKMGTLVQKDSSGRARKYLMGTSSGISKDAHGEQMSMQCIDSFVKQFEEKSIPLVHPHTDNLNDNAVGILSSWEKGDDGELKTIFRVFDEFDDVSQTKKDKAKDFWAMVTGAEPYGKPTRISQFSIQGLLDEKDVVKTANGSVINNIELDAIAAVTKGAYGQEDFTAMEKGLFTSASIYKQVTKIRKGELQQALQNERLEQDFMEEGWKLQGALRDVQREILTSNQSPEEKKARMEATLEEYKTESISFFEKFNFIDPSESEGGDTTMTEEEKRKAEEEEAKRKAAEEEAKRKADEEAAAGSSNGNSELAEKLLTISQMLADVASLAAGNGSNGAGEVLSEEEKRKAAEEEEKRKAALEQPDSNTSDEINPTVKELKATLKKLGLSDDAIAKQVQEVKKQSNPIYGVNEKMDRLEKQNQLLAESIVGLTNGLSEMIPALAQGGTQINLRKSIAGNGATIDAKETPEEKAKKEKAKQTGYVQKNPFNTIKTIAQSVVGAK